MGNLNPKPLNPPLNPKPLNPYTPKRVLRACLANTNLETKAKPRSNLNDIKVSSNNAI